MQNAGIIASAVVQVPVVFLTVTPGMADILKADNDRDATVIRHTNYVAAGISVFIGVALSVAAGDSTPLLFTLVTVAIMVLVVERLTTLQDARIIGGNNG